ncbi:hypothetical protein [Polynucleobacter sp.]|uniref:hypothetical protein n=1 Tax=Polynucleobacter sp. TaxID=2029855 RepID=UPI00301B521B
MDMNSKKQYLKELQKEYLGATKKRKAELLDEAEKRTGQNRKYLTRRLSAKTRWDKPKRPKSTRKREFGSDLIIHLVRLWDIFDNPCGQRLVVVIRDELKRLRQFKEITTTDSQAEKLLKMSARTIDLLLIHEKEVRLLKSKYEKKKHPLLYQQIPTKMSNEWDRDILGQIQIDGVEHCGHTTLGQYANTISNTDISSHWWEGEAVSGKGQARTLEAIKLARSRFPYDWHEIHPDNGTSFINYFIYDYAKLEMLEFSRSRPYQKNDNCFVEQKNSQNVRKVVGHLRYDTSAEIAALNDLYRNELRLYKNFFQPVMRLESKERNKGHISRKYQEAKTPYQWLLDSDQTPEEVKLKLREIYSELNPADLKRKIDLKLKMLAKIYQEKQHNIEEEETETTTSKVTFLNCRRSGLGLPVLVA